MTAWTRGTALRVCAGIAVLLLVGCFTASADSKRALLRVSATSLVFAATQGGSNPASQSISVSNGGVGVLRWTVMNLTGASWLALSTTQGTNTGTVTVSASTAGLSAGTYSGTLRFSSSTGGSADVAISFSVKAPSTQPTANVPPTVQLTSPASGQSFSAGATITLSATANDSDGGVRQVDFYAGSALIGSDATSPYSVPWSNVAAGTYSITAVATDVAGAQTRSAAATITVAAAAADAPPTVSITAPANGSSYTAPATVSVTASAGDSDGTVSRVDFFANGAPIGSATTSPFTVSWANVAGGTYSVTATATDNSGSKATSAPIAVTVSTSSYDYAISPGENIQNIVNIYPNGAKFQLKAGVHRMQQIVPKSGQSFTGESGAILSGARLLSSFARSGNYWVATGQSQWAGVQGQCESGYEGCAYSNDLFIDDVPLKRVLSLGAVVSGTWYFDDAADTIYFANDPTGHKVETSVSTVAFDGSASNVTITGLVIEKYANAAQKGAIQGDATSGWIVQNNEVRYNHGVGLRIGSTMQALNNKIHHNGQMGMGGYGAVNALVQGNEIAYNNALHFESGWEAGGTKFCGTNYLTVRGNYSHDNRGPGLWTDIDNINTLYEQNDVEYNRNAGIFHEISYAAVIRNNTIRYNGISSDGWLWSAGIQIAASPNVEIYGNTVENNVNGISAIQQNRGTGAYGAREISNLYVHDNTVRMASGATGMVQDVGDTSYFSSRNNRFVHNTYYLGANATYYAWMNNWVNDSGWRGYGEDASGTFIRF